MHAVSTDLFDIGGEAAFDLKPEIEKVRQKGLDVINLSIGDVFYSVVNDIEEINRIAAKVPMRYGSPLGEFELREAIARYFSRRALRADIDPEFVYVSIGAKGALVSSLRCSIRPGSGDEIICFSPYFPSYVEVTKLLGVRPVVISLREEFGFRPDYRELEKKINSKTRAIIVNSPHNPTGSMLEKEDYDRIDSLVTGKNIMVIFDEVYYDLVYDRQPLSALNAIPDLFENGQATIIGSLSKSHALPGLRLGFGTTSEEYIEQIHKIQTHLFSCPPTTTQEVGKIILNNEDKYSECREVMKKEFVKRRDLLVNGFNDMDEFKCGTPSGAIYVYPIAKSINSEILSRELLEKTGVACLDGKGFGDEGNGLRFAFSTEDVTRLEEALSRIKRII